MNKIYLSAYCRQNLGDDLFVKSLLERYPQEKFFMFVAPKLKMAFSSCKNLKTPSKAGFFLYRCLQKLGAVNIKKVHRHYSRKCKATVKIGGSVFIEPKDWKGGSGEALFEGDVYYVGCNFGPYKSESFLEDVKSRLINAKDCCFRDKYSYNIFSDLKNVRYAPDVLFGYQGFPKPCKGNGVGISVISLDSREELERYKDTYYATIASLCDLCARKGIPVTLFSFCDAEGDVLAINSILAKTENAHAVEVCRYNGDTEGFLCKLNERESILATRFHAMIIGWSMGKAVLPVIYSEKQSHVIDDVHFDGYIWNLRGGEAPAAEILLEKCMNNKRLETVDLAAEAKKQFAAFEQIL